MSALMMTMCTKACMDSNNLQSTYSCEYSNAGHEGPHAPHDWFSHVYNSWQHCHGKSEDK